MSVLEGSPTGLITHFVGIGITLSICPAICKRDGQKNILGRVREGNNNTVLASANSFSNVNPVNTVLIIHFCHRLVIHTIYYPK